MLARGPRSLEISFDHDQIFQCFKKLAADLPGTINDNLQNNYLGSLTGGTNQYDYTLKGDVNVTEKMRFSLLTQHGANTQPGLGPNGGPQLPLPYTSSRYGPTLTWLDQFNMSYTITPTLVNVFGFSWNRFDTPFTDPTTGGGWAAKVGLTGLPPGQASDVFPSVYFGGPDAPHRCGTTTGVSLRAFSTTP